MNAVSKAQSITFAKYDVQWETGDIYFHYSIARAEGAVEFCERWHIDDIISTDHVPKANLQAILRALHLLVGISYYKMYCPPTIYLTDYSLSLDEANFWNALYTKGLGEFFYKNEIEYKNLVRFPYDSNRVASHLEALDYMHEKALVLHGGGKDSIVSAEIVASSPVPFDLFVLNPTTIHRNVAQVMEKKAISIIRTIDSKVKTLNASDTVFNGHVPISAIYSFAAILMALLKGYRYVIISSERSSNYGNVSYLGEQINHQWSKSQEAEDMIRQYITNYIAPEIKYFSLLRPFYEIAVAKKFAKLSKYFSTFSSSNHHFKIEQNDHKQRWDFASPKTLFVFAMLSAFIPKNEMMQIFEDNLYMHNELCEKFKELLGLHNVKPFECVGTPEETMVAMWRAHESGEYADTPIMKMFEQEVVNKRLAFAQMEKEVLSYGDDSRIPDIFRTLL